MKILDFGLAKVVGETGNARRLVARRPIRALPTRPRSRALPVLRSTPAGSPYSSQRRASRKLMRGPRPMDAGWPIRLTSRAGARSTSRPSTCQHQRRPLARPGHRCRVRARRDLSGGATAVSCSIVSEDRQMMAVDIAGGQAAERRDASRTLSDAGVRRVGRDARRSAISVLASRRRRHDASLPGDPELASGPATVGLRDLVVEAGMSGAKP